MLHTTHYCMTGLHRSAAESYIKPLRNAVRGVPQTQAIAKGSQRKCQ